MDTKLRKSKPFTAWLCFFIAVNIIIGLLITSLSALDNSGGNPEIFKVPFTDYKSSVVFKEQTANYFRQLFLMVANPSRPERQEWAKQYLDKEGENLIYYAVNSNNGLLVKNITGDLLPISDTEKIPPLPEGYNYCWYFDGQKVWIIENGQPIDAERLDSGYRSLNFGLRQDIPLSHDTDNMLASSNIKIILAVKDSLVKNPYEHSLLYETQQLTVVHGWIYIAFLTVGFSLFIYYLIKRKDKQDFDRKLASWLKQIWLEVKILLSLLALTLSVGFSYTYSSGWNYTFEWLWGTFVITCFMLLGFWWFYFMFIDLIINRKAFFTHNLVNSLLNWYAKYEKRYSWQKSMLKRAYILVASEAVLALISVLFLLAAIAAGSSGAFLMALIIAGVGTYLIYRYLQRYSQTINDWGILIDHIERIKNGDMNSQLNVAENADIYPVAQNLNSIQEGINIAVTEKIKSERLKVDLITNVSHDLKTPLTSIISYVDLLKREEDLPEHVSDYIKILVQKSERLKNLIQDIFDLSKASSNNIGLDMEQLDLARLIKQTLADMEEPINASGLAFRLNIPEEPVFIVSDGKKLYRVWENLISNALKYSLPGSRIFIDLEVNEKDILATIKNTANYEMNFSEDEILQRFARGEKSRSSEGSGLGLSIAQSFTHICGGDFSIKIDGDLFKVELHFKKISS